MVAAGLLPSIFLTSYLLAQSSLSINRSNGKNKGPSFPPAISKTKNYEKNMLLPRKKHQTRGGKRKDKELLLDVSNTAPNAKNRKKGRFRPQRITNDTINKNPKAVVAELVSPLPSLTFPNGPRPSYYTCRHTFESTLIYEIVKRISEINPTLTVKASSPCPGLIRVEDGSNILPPNFDPVYALQSIPSAVVVSGDSIRNIAKKIYHTVLFKDKYTDDIGDDDTTIPNHLCEDLSAAPRGSLTIHALVPGMCKGQRNPIMLNRSKKVAEELEKMLQKRFPAARKKKKNDGVNDIVVINKGNLNNGDDDETEDYQEKWLLQILLQTHSLFVASLTRCKYIGPTKDCYWPNWYHHLGLANVDIAESMPSSAYRKLMEAFECMRLHPSSMSNAIDLGASPGGWTALLRRFNCQVTAVDRSPLHNTLMNDKMVSFVKGDAFTFIPDASMNKYKKVAETPQSFTATTAPPKNSWMVSDVIAFPERVVELLERWCGNHWVSHLVVTMKFQGDEPALTELDRAMKVCKVHGYECRAKHFFNNKNEVTLMAVFSDCEIEA